MNSRKGFSLVELVVVILIIGILAAVAVPRFFSTSDRAVDGSAIQTLAVIRTAIELYTAENDNTLPGQNDDLPEGLDEYLRDSTFPKCPVALKDSSIEYVATDDGSGASTSPTASWKYFKDTGRFIINDASPTKSDPGKQYDEL